MLAEASSPLAVNLHFLDKDKNFPAGQVCPNFQEGDFKSYDDVVAFGQSVDVLSIEIENVNTDALKALEAQGKKVFPKPSTIAMIKDKGLQKEFYKENGLATSAFTLIESKQELMRLISEGQLSFPFVQKSREAGYDGKGVAIIKSEQDYDHIMDTASVIEDLVPIEKELAITVACNESGEKVFYPVVEMVFNEQGNLLDYLLSPSSVTDEIKEECRKLAADITESLNYVGLLAIELFLTKSGEVIINEMAPRTHNSGHHTIDASNFSQFELHLRTLIDLPLRPINQNGLAIMYNLLGEVGYTGDVIYEGLEEVLKMEDVFVHLYGKSQTKPLRKMGHVTLIGKDLVELKSKLDFIKKTLKVKA